MRRNLSYLLLALACGSSVFAGDKDMAFGLSLGYLHPADEKKVLLSQGSLFTNANVATKDGFELGLDLSVIHGERFSTRWGMTISFQDVKIGNYPSNVATYDNTGGVTRTGLGGYLQGNFNLVNGVGKSWFLTAGGVYNSYSITPKGGGSTDLDKVSKAGVVFGTGVSFNGKTMRWTPEVLVQKIGEETTGIFRLHCQVQF